MTVITAEAEAMERLAAYAERYATVYNGIDRIKDEATEFSVTECSVGWMVQVKYLDSPTRTVVDLTPSAAVDRLTKNV